MRTCVRVAAAWTRTTSVFGGPQLGPEQRARPQVSTAIALRKRELFPAFD